MRRLVAFIRLSRLHFLVFSTLPYLLGLVLAWGERGALDWPLVGLGLAVQLLVQLATAYLNDYWDLPTDRLNTRRTLLTGGSGELATGLLPPGVALAAGLLCLGAALALALLATVAFAMPPASWLVLVAAIANAVFYTAPPVQLSWRGLGEFATALTAALLVPLWASSLQTGRLSGEVVRLGLPLLPLIAGMMLGIATPDIQADRPVGKRTLAVIVGPHRVPALYAALVALGYLAALLLLPQVGPLLVLVSLPMAVWAWHGLRAHLRLGGWPLLWMVVRAALVPALALALLIATRWPG